MVSCLSMALVVKHSQPALPRAGLAFTSAILLRPGAAARAEEAKMAHVWTDQDDTPLISSYQPRTHALRAGPVVCASARLADSRRRGLHGRGGSGAVDGVDDRRGTGMRCNPIDSAFAGSPTLGLTKREWFAGMMMSAILAHPPNGEVLRLQCELKIGRAHV